MPGPDMGTIETALASGQGPSAGRGRADAADLFLAPVVQAVRPGARGGTSRFAGDAPLCRIDLGREPVPDEMTVCRFRHLLEEHDLGRPLFDEVQRHLAAREPKIARGTLWPALEPTQLAIMAEAMGVRTMDANELRALQAPLKKQYREQPETGRTPARAEAILDLDRVACRVRSRGSEIDAGLHPATGGNGKLACSADMLLEALVACAGVTISAVATAMGVKLRSGRVIAEGHWDARGTLGVDRDVPVGLTDIALRFELDTDADAATVQRLVEMSERFCVIYQTLRTPPRLSITHQIVPGA